MCELLGDVAIELLFVTGRRVGVGVDPSVPPHRGGGEWERDAMKKGRERYFNPLGGVVSAANDG